MNDNLKSNKIILLEKILRFMAKSVLKRHKPKIVSITGSVGKTSTKNAIFKVLSQKFSVRENQKNYNNEIGIPLTIIGAESGGRNLLKWINVLIKWIITMIYPKYPQILILELGIDRPKDMKYFMSFIDPFISIVTNVSFSHIEFFKTIENIAKEKRVIIEKLSSQEFAILNADDELVLDMKNNTKAQVITFGFSENAQINASNLIYNYQDGIPVGISFKLNYDGKNIPVRLRNILAGHYVYAALAAISVGIIFKINLVEIATFLESIESPVGRMNLLKGIKESYIIDDTYNASPVSTSSAIDVLSKLAEKRKIVILGDMLELGDKTEFGHKEVARKIFSSKIDCAILVGDRMRYAKEELVSLGYEIKNIIHFESPIEASRFILNFILPQDFILVKGSQGMRMEKIVEKILSNKYDAKKVLCRQNKQWLEKPFIKS